MKKQENFDDVYSYIQDAADVPLPETLSPDAIVQTLENIQIQPRRRHIARYVSLAAALAIITLVGIVGFRLIHVPYAGGAVSAPKTPQDVQIAAEAEDVYLRATSYAEIEKFFLEKQKDYKSKRYAEDMEFLGGVFNPAKSGLPESAADSSTVNSASGSAKIPTANNARAHGETNTQVEGVDEADILKNDGEYLYVVRAEPCVVDIIDIRAPHNMQSAAQIECASETDGRRVRELYVYEDTLVLLYDVCASYENGEADLYKTCYSYVVENMKTAVEVYDISNRTAPRLRFEYAVDGGQISSRMDGGALLLVTSYNVPIYKDETDMKNACVPCTYQAGEKVRFPSENIRIVSETDSTEYLTVSRLDTQTAGSVLTKAVLGGGSEIYCDGDNLLVAQADYTEFQKESEATQNDIARIAAVNTRLYAFDLKGGIAYKGSVQVKGTTLNQFSMDSFGGCYRIATTASDGSLVTVLNKSLEIIGELSGIAKGEAIYAARFMGDTAYLVTFYQTDPLFVIDLSDPAAPKVTGELKIPGFSNYLHPYSENLLIGVGQDGTETGANRQLKISLFDVSDKQNPKEISKAIYNGSSVSTSAAQSTHKAFLTVRESGEFAIPVHETDDSYTRHTYYASMLAVHDGKLQRAGTYRPAAGDSEVTRITYAGNTVFTLSESSTLTAFDKETGEILSELSYNRNSAGGVTIE